MKKKFAIVLSMIFCVAFAFAGCDLFALNNAKYLSAPIAQIQYTLDNGKKHTVTITREELIQAQNRYGETLSNSGKTGKSAVNYLVDHLINQEITINETSRLIANGEILTTNAEKDEYYNKVWENTYDSLLQILADYESAVIKDWDLTTPSEITEEESTAKTFEEYEKQAEIIQGQDGEWYIHVLDKEENPTINHTYVDDESATITSIKSAYADKVDSSTVLKEAQKRYMNDLKDYAKSKGKSTKDVKVWENEIKRVYNIMKDNAYLELYSEYLQGEIGKSSISVNDVFYYLQESMKHSYTKYSIDTNTFKSDILSNRASMNYVLDEDKFDLGEYFYVSHILVKFTDAQKEALTDLDNALKAGEDPNVINAERRKIIDATKVKLNGEATSMTVSELYDRIQNDIEGKSAEQKMEIFRDYMFDYNEDDGNKNAEYEYIVGTEDSKMVKSFTNVARELYDEGNGNFGDILWNYDEYLSLPHSDVESEYGIHILFYAGAVENVFEINENNFESFSLTNATGETLEANIERIQTFKLTEFNTKTIFDLVYEKLVSDDIAYLQTLNLNALKDDAKITTYPKNISALY